MGMSTVLNRTSWENYTSPQSLHCKRKDHTIYHVRSSQGQEILSGKLPENINKVLAQANESGEKQVVPAEGRQACI